MNFKERQDKALKLFFEYNDQKQTEVGKSIKEEIFLLYYDEIKNYTNRITKHISDKSLVEDLFQEACLKCLDAIDNFQPERETNFYSYVISYTKPIIERKQNIFSKDITEYENLNLYKIKKIYQEYSEKKMSPPTTKQISNILGVRISTAQKYVDLYNNEPVFLNQSINSDNSKNVEISETIGSGENVAENVHNKIFKETLLEELNKLDPIRLYVIKNYFGIDCPSKTTKEISEDLKKMKVDKTEKKVSELCYRTLKKLRKNEKVIEIYKER